MEFSPHNVAVGGERRGEERRGEEMREDWEKDAKLYQMQLCMGNVTFLLLR